MRFEAGSAARILPTAALALAGWALTWLATGSIAAADWLPYAFLAGLLLAVVLFAGGANRPRGLELAALAALLALAGWGAISLTWSAVPSLARDEALLTLFYAVVFAVPLLTLRTAGDRLFATATVAAAAGVLAVSTGLVLRFAGNQADHFYTGRLSFPISYPNAQAAVFLVGFWPAIVLAAQRGRSLFTRAAALAAATAISCGWLTAQSKGGVFAIAASAALLFAVSPLRLRLLGPALLAAGLTAAAYGPLTAPFRSESPSALVSDVRGAGAAILVLTVAGAIAGLIYALVDRRLELSPAAVRAAGIGALGLFLACLAAAVAVFFVSVNRPGWFNDQWRAFKNVPTNSASSHLLQLGSNRYDFWRVALKEFERHPLAGIGSRGFGPAYLELRHGTQPPVRAHSVELDVLSELGIVGLVLFVAALALPFIPLVRRVRLADPAASAVFGAATYWLAHASVDWIWTVPACGVPFFLLLGTGTAGGERATLPRRVSALSGALLAAVALLAFVPPWLGARLSARGQIAWAKRLDPLSPAPYIAQSVRASTATAAIPPLEAAVRKEPRVVEWRFDLARAYIRAHRWSAARRTLLAARRLDPGEPQIAGALRRLPQGRRAGSG